MVSNTARDGSTGEQGYLRIAVPNKGALSEAASTMLREAGYRQRDDNKRLTLLDDENGVEFFYLRPRDIALYVGEGTLDVGITGRDLLHDSGAKAEEALQLGFGRSRFRFAAPVGRYTSLDDLAGRRIATSYVGIVEAFLERQGIDASVTRLDGAVESSIQLGVADVIADVVETGSTLRQAGLEVFGETILESEAVVITRGGGDVPAAFETFRRRIEGVLVARSYVMMDYDIRAQDVPAASRLAPGLEGPTVSPLHREGWVAVRVMVPRDGAQKLMDDLWALGARAILLTDIHACRL
jgi:ATP phosphoribosyltransferase